MPCCRDLDPLLTSYVDGEASARDRETVETHVGKCPPCRDRLAEEQTARDVLAAHRDSLRCRASEGLKRRCAAHRDATGHGTAIAVPARRPFSRRAMVPLSMAATLLLAVAGVFFFGFNDSVEALAAQLAVDHVKCFQFAPGESTQASALALGQQWTASRGWAIKVPASDAAQKLQLLTVRRCASTSGLAAHMMYRWRGKPLSIFVVNNAGAGATAQERFIRTIRQDAIVWSDRGRTYAIVAQGPPSDLEPVVRYVRQTAE